MLMTETEICKHIVETMQPGWSQSNATKEQLQALAERQQKMIDSDRSCYLTFPDGSTDQVPPFALL